MNQRFVDVLAPRLRFLGDRTVTAESPLADLGMDSMQAIDVLFDLEDAFGVALPDDELNDTTFATAGSLWAALVRAGVAETAPLDGRAAA